MKSFKRRYFIPDSLISKHATRLIAAIENKTKLLEVIREPLH